MSAAPFTMTWGWLGGRMGGLPGAGTPGAGAPVCGTPGATAWPRPIWEAPREAAGTPMTTWARNEAAPAGAAGLGPVVAAIPRMVAGMECTLDFGAMSLKGTGMTRFGVTGASACGRCCTGIGARLGGLPNPLPLGLTCDKAPGCAAWGGLCAVACCGRAGT